jgi:hypothetical protein
MRTKLVAAAVALVALASAARASDPVGVYALIDKVVLEPKESNAERVQIWGVFAFAAKGNPDQYTDPAYGYLYCELPGEKADQAKLEWADLWKIAGKGQCVALGNRYAKEGQPRLRPAAEKPQKPDPYPVAGGLVKLRPVHYEATKLRSLPRPMAPADGGEATAGEVTLQARGITDRERQGVKYVFEVSGPEGGKETSDPVAVGEGQTARWKPKMHVKAGEKYDWRVWAVTGDWKGPVAAAAFKGK